MDRRPIPGLDGFEVDADANVYAIKKGRSVALRCGLHSNGYRIFYARRRQCLVSRAVCAAFHGPPPTPRHEAAHVNGNTKNNSPSNLAWKTHKENEADKARHGTVMMGSKHWAARLDESAVAEIRRLRLAGDSLPNLAARFGVRPQAIYKIVHGLRWKHVPLHPVAEAA